MTEINKDNAVTIDILEDLYRINRMIEYKHNIKEISNRCYNIIKMAIDNSIKFIENERDY